MTISKNRLNEIAAIPDKDIVILTQVKWLCCMDLSKNPKRRHKVI